MSSVEKLLAFIESGSLTPDMLNRQVYSKQGVECGWDLAICKKWGMMAGFSSSVCDKMRMDDYRALFHEIIPNSDHCLSKVFSHIRGYTGGMALLTTHDLCSIGMLPTFHAEAPADAVDMYFHVTCCIHSAARCVCPLCCAACTRHCLYSSTHFPLSLLFSASQHLCPPLA